MKNENFTMVQNKHFFGKVSYSPLIILHTNIIIIKTRKTVCIIRYRIVILPRGFASRRKLRIKLVFQECRTGTTKRRHYILGEQRIDMECQGMILSVALSKERKFYVAVARFGI